MREVVLDTETTGLTNKGERIVEVGAMSLLTIFTGNTFIAISIPC